jgi:hypothetical protein
MGASDNDSQDQQLLFKLVNSQASEAQVIEEIESHVRQHKNLAWVGALQSFCKLRALKHH